MLVTPLGEPVPPQSVVSLLAAVDERLTIKWVPSVAGAYWAICEAWRRGDPRWELVQQGLMRESEAFDILKMLPPDCPAEQAEGILMRHFGRTTDPRQEAAEAIARVQQHNTKQKEAHVESFLSEQEEKHARQTKHELKLSIGATDAHPISHGIGDSPRTKRRKAAQGDRPS
jgi:hypothetical protein